ncbi:SDR family oxidoreductase [Saccharothrix sp. S26]|uniref:SDR family NAD(P)-dependent oxidoreductase n=1 Tax=Saccharothrix sp. S26 TaxID=2907215 RepID=UPI001F303563|nr:SDR family oxidoreductase [Saccharothrix sp. S26]MCE7000886.1 SDR family oxidoreductase [Saccharothrix sp. S26]
MTIFTGKAVVVTGAGTGIGRATARAFAAQGASVLAVGRTAATLAETAADHPRTRTLTGDVTDAHRVVDAAVAEFGRIDVLVNNAAVRSGDSMAVTNLFAPARLVEAALPHLKQSRGVVVNVSTAIGQRGWPLPGGELYAALKSALDSLTRSWAVQYAPHGVRVVAVAPGPIATPMHEHRDRGPEEAAALRDALVAHVPLGRVGQPEEVAFWVVQLARPEAAYTTGVVLPVDGGALVG